MSDLIEEGKQLKEVWPLVQRTYHLSLSQIVLNSHAAPKYCKTWLSYSIIFKKCNFILNDFKTMKLPEDLQV